MLPSSDIRKMKLSQKYLNITENSLFARYVCHSVGCLSCRESCGRWLFIESAETYGQNLSITLGATALSG